ncbi:temptin-like [Saccostrea cucullata]|uniref:temptin-like n=1 Tax=Saccostrea cuccullata TaxID=36930 RepID=UPI002ED19A7E
MILFYLSLIGLSSVGALPYYRDRIPNGYKVFNPCGSSYWEAVGHYSPFTHTAEKNPFALDFKAAGHTWTRALCMKDSDGDGKTNGEELGDPHCHWTEGGTPKRSSTGQPGICEPVGSGPCTSVVFFCGCQGSACVSRN